MPVLRLLPSSDDLRDTIALLLERLCALHLDMLGTPLHLQLMQTTGCPICQEIDDAQAILADIDGHIKAEVSATIGHTPAYN